MEFSLHVRSSLRPPESGEMPIPHFTDEEIEAQICDFAESTDVELRHSLRLPWWVLAGARPTPTSRSPEHEHL